MKYKTNWKAFFILLGASLFSIICVFPYVVSLQGDLLAKTGYPLGLIFLIQFIQSTIMFSIAIYLGLFFTKKINFQLPLIEYITSKSDYKKVIKDCLWKTILIGIITAVLIYVADILFTLGGAAISTHQNYAPVWQKFLAAFYGGITEEILMRLFIMSFFIWIIMKLFRQNQPKNWNIILSILISAVIFGLGHLPITASLTKLTGLIIMRAIVLNGIGGIFFGWLFWKKGLESAMIAHFTTDIFLLTILPLLFS